MSLPFKPSFTSKDVKMESTDFNDQIITLLLSKKLKDKIKNEGGLTISFENRKKYGIDAGFRYNINDDKIVISFENSDLAANFAKIFKLKPV